MALTVKLKYNANSGTARPYPWRWFSVGVISFSVILIVVLALLNVILVGYDIVPGVIHDSRDLEKQHWWDRQPLARLVDGPGSCNSVSFHEGQIFQTNMSMFDYQILEIPPLPKGSPADSIAALSYFADPLGNCIVRDVMLRADFASREAQLVAIIYCNEPFPSILRTRVISSDIPDLDDFLRGYTRPHLNGLHLDPKSTSVFTTVFGTLYYLSQDLFAGWWSGGPATVTYSVNQTCGYDIDLKNRIDSNCESSPYNLNVERLIKISADGRQADSLATEARNLAPGSPIANQTLAVLLEPGNNLIHAFIHALHVDLGHWTSNNIFIHEDALLNTLNPADSITSLLTNPNPTRNALQLPECTYGCDLAKGSWASTILQNALAFDIPVQNISRHPSVIHVDYVCPKFRLKSMDTLLAAVFNATYSMFMTAWVCIIFVAVFFAKRAERKESIAASGNANNQEIESGGGSPPDTHTSTHQEKRKNVTQEHVSSALEWVGGMFEHASD